MTSGQRLPFRRRFLQIGLRKFLYFCLAIGLGLAVGSNYIDSVRSTVKLVEQLEEGGFRVHSDFIERYGVFPYDRTTLWRRTFEWSLSDPTEVMALAPSSQGMRESLRRISRLPGVDLVRLSFTDLDGKDLHLLTRMPDLVQLELQGTNVQDPDLEELAEMDKLRVLDLSQTRITDRGLNALARMKSLRMLTVYNTQVSRSAIARLRRLRPDMHINGAILHSAVRQPQTQIST